MLYLYESKIPVDKTLLIGLQVIFGVGKKNSQKVCKKLGFCPNLKGLSKKQVFKLNKILPKLKFIFGKELKKFELENFRRKLKIKLLKSFRKMNGLPVRGQRTHTNAKTAKKQLKINLND